MLRNKWVYLIAIVALIVVLGIVAGVYFSSNSNDYVATVDGEKVTKAEYNVLLYLVKNSFEQYYGIGNDENAKKEFWNSKVGDETLAATAKKSALDSAKEYKILLIKAKEKNITLNKNEEAELKTKLDSEIKSLGGNAEDTVKAEYGVNIKQFREVRLKLRLVEKVKSELIKATDEEAKQHFDKNKDVREKIEKVTVRHILFLTVDPNTNAELSKEKQAEAKKKADAVLKKIKAGEDMATLAKEQTEDTSSKENGGEITFTRGQMVTEFESWSFKAKVGDLDIVKTQYGYHVIRLEAKINSYKDLKDAAKQELINKKYADVMDPWKKDKKYNIVPNQKVLDSIKVI